MNESRINSSTKSEIFEKRLPYAYSESLESWGQPPTTHFHFNSEGKIISGYPNMPTSASYKVAGLTSNYDFLMEISESTPDTELEAWDALSDEALSALYKEAAEEDLFLARLGLAHYAEMLRQEEAE